MMGLTMNQRRAVTKTIATRYKRASRAEKGAMMFTSCMVMPCHVLGGDVVRGGGHVPVVTGRS